jgi:hypothetical protein
MEGFYLWLFIGACGAVLLWGVLQPTRVYQYPFLIAAIFSAFLVPQAIALYDNPLDVSMEAIDQAFAMGALCVMAAWVGYQLNPTRNVRGADAPVYSNKRLRLCALAITVVSLLATFEMTSIPEAEIKTGTGPFTILAFFSGLASMSFAYFLITAIQRPTYASIFLTLVSGYPIYSAALFAGRRGETSIFFMSIALAFFFVKRWVPARVVALAAVIIVAFLIPLFARVRGEFWVALASGELGSLEWSQSLNYVLSGQVLELRNAAAEIDSISRTGAFGLGTGYWDAIVFRYVPGQLVGFDVKDALQFHWNSNLYDDVGYRHYGGTTVTAVGDTYVQFGYLGCLFFLAQGYLFKNIWVRAARSNSIVAQIAYISLMTPAMMGVTHGSKWFLQAGLSVAIVLWAMARFSLVSRPRAKWTQSSTQDFLSSQ